MKNIKLNLDYTSLGLKVEEGKEKDKDTQCAELTQGYIEGSVSQKYKDGLQGQMRRMFGRIQRKLDAAVENKTYLVELEEAEFDFIKKAVDEALMPTHISKYVVLVEDELERAAQEKQEKKEE